MKYFFTADEHFGHTNIIKYCNRPFKDAGEMDNEIIKRFNEVVSPEDMTYHLGDFTLRSTNEAERCIERLNGQHSFIFGSHDKWNPTLPHIYIKEETIEGQKIIMCHYAMRTWPEGHYKDGAWQLYGHSHGKLPGIGRQMDVGVDTNNFYPYSFDDIKRILKNKEHVYPEEIFESPKGR